MVPIKRDTRNPTQSEIQLDVWALLKEFRYMCYERRLTMYHHQKEEPMSKYNIHNDFKKYEYMKLSLSPLLLPLINSYITKSLNKIEPPEGVQETKKKILGYQNGSIELTIISPTDIRENAPCLIYYHGGAFALKAAPYHKNLLYQYAIKTPCKVIFVDYRLTPEYAFPVAVEDCYAAFQWVCENAEVFGIDKNNIAVGGDSAGGALTAAVTLIARDRKAPGICFQMLIYPVTDARQTTESMKKYVDTPMWNSKLNKKMWEIYLRDGIHSNREYASPMEAASLANLPNAYVEVAEYDCLRDEGINYAEALRQSGITVELYQPKGTIHGFEMAEDSDIVNLSITKRVAALKEAFR